LNEARDRLVGRGHQLAIPACGIDLHHCGRFGILKQFILPNG
jgi:hypothetical protein